MPDKNEIERRKQIKRDLRENAKIKFENSLPMSRQYFIQLFDFLNKKLSEYGCDDSLKLTTEFLQQKCVEKINETESWLQENGGYCDCEVLYNIEEMFDENVIV